jgi:hypothetical protein
VVAGAIVAAAPGAPGGTDEVTAGVYGANRELDIICCVSPGLDENVGWVGGGRVKGAHA